MIPPIERLRRGLGYPVPTVAEVLAGPEFDQRWNWKTRLPERFSHRCRVLARARTMGSVEVEFSDGYRVITGRHAVRAA